MKGIFPKEPKKHFKGVNKTYYALKDIKYLGREKLLTKFRQIKAYEKKIIKAKHKEEKFDAKKLIENKPSYSIDHIIKERYPRFIDAIQDMDDALCLINLFSNLPKYDLLKISSETVNLCKRVIREFNLYTAIAQNFKKGFLSFKGVYLSSEIMGNRITWLSPFNHPQKMSYEIDYDIMLNFLELYISMMKFVNFKLFKDIGLQYPPPEENSDLPFFGFNSLNIKSFQDKLRDNKATISDEVNLQSEEWKKIMAKEEESKRLKSLFNGCVFYINREVQNELFAMVIMSCGGLYGDESDTSAFKENDKKITHYIIDRPAEFITLKKNKEYVQPQWIFDCVNRRQILPVSTYGPGKKLPPHLSPFYEIKEDGTYVYEEDYDNDNDEDVLDNEEGTIKKRSKTKEATKEQKELQEMMMTNNKKKVLKKIREEQLKKKKKLTK